MNRNEIKRLLVLTEIADDYEEPEHVYWNVSSRATLCGITIQHVEVLTILVDLIEGGWAKAYGLSGPGPVDEIQGAPGFDQLQDYYYWITE